MSVDQDIIEILLKVKDDEAERAKIALEQLNNSAKALDASLSAGTITKNQYDQSLKQISVDASRARDSLQSLRAEMRSLSQQGGLATPKLVGADRAAGIAQAGMFGANTLQDVLQGGPASGINNVLGALGNGKIRALGAEFVEAAGGASGLATKLGAIGAAAFAAFELVDAGLKSAKLDWSDLDDIATNSAPFVAVKETLVGIGEVMSQLAKDYHLDAAWEGTSGAVLGVVHAIAEATLGWDEATEAARRHKEEVKQQVKAAHDYADAVKSLASVKSDEQKKAEDTGKLVGKEIADLGGAGGFNAVADRLAKLATPKDGDEKTTIKSVGDNNKVVEEEVTKREKKRRELMAEIGQAYAGDTAALDRLKPLLKGAGYDLTNIEQAASGRDLTKEEKADKKEEDKDEAKSRDAFNASEKTRADKDYKDFTDRTKEITKNLQERYDQTTATGGKVDRDMVRDKIVAGGATAEEADAQADEVLKALREGYADRVAKISGEKGVDAAGAAGVIAEEGAEKRKQESDKKKQAGEAADRERKEAFEKATAGTGIEERAKRGMIQAVMDGATYQDVRANGIAQASAEAQMGGMGAEDAQKAATSFIDSLLGKVGDERVKDSLDDKTKSPEHIAVADFARTVESAGMAEAKKTNELLGAQNEKLDELIRKTGGGAKF